MLLRIKEPIRKGVFSQDFLTSSSMRKWFIIKLPQIRFLCRSKIPGQCIHIGRESLRGKVQIKSSGKYRNTRRTHVSSVEVGAFKYRQSVRSQIICRIWGNRESIEENKHTILWARKDPDREPSMVFLGLLGEQQKTQVGWVVES